MLFLCAAGHSSPGPKGPHGEDGPDAENSPPASPAGNVNPRVQGFLPSLNTQGPCSRGDAREVDVASILACDRRTREATGGGGLGHSPPLTAATTKAVPKVPGLLFHTVPPCLSSMRLAASPPPSRLGSQRCRAWGKTPSLPAILGQEQRNSGHPVGVGTGSWAGKRAGSCGPVPRRWCGHG